METAFFKICKMGNIGRKKNQENQLCGYALSKTFNAERLAVLLTGYCIVRKNIYTENLSNFGILSVLHSKKLQALSKTLNA